MSKISMMGSGAIDPINVTKRVFWRPETPGTVLKEGQPVCYNSDAVVDHKERAADASGHLGLTSDTFAQGEQEFTGRLFIVEEPLTANLDHFAGIVKSLGVKAGADGDMIEIFTPVEGAMVPVYTDENCTEERTILGIRNGEASVSYPGRPIGIAQETYDRSGGTTDGMVWMKFRNFEYAATNAAGDATANSLIIDDEAAANAVCIKSMNVRFDGTGRARGLLYVGEIAGAGHCAYGMFKFRTYVSAALSQNAHCICANLHFKDDAELAAPGTPEYASAPLYLSLETEYTAAYPDLSGGNLAAIYIGYYVNESIGAPLHAHVLYINGGGGYGFDGLLQCQNASDIGFAAQVGATVSNTIPMEVAGSVYYFMISSIA